MSTSHDQHDPAGRTDAPLWPWLVIPAVLLLIAAAFIVLPLLLAGWA